MRLFRGAGLYDPTVLPLLTLPALFYQIIFTNLSPIFLYSVITHISLLLAIYFSIPAGFLDYLNKMRIKFSEKIKLSSSYNFIFLIVFFIGLLFLLFSLITYINMVSSGITNTSRLDYLQSNRKLDILIQLLNFFNFVGTLCLSNKHTDRLYILTLFSTSIASLSRASILFLPIYLVGFFQLRYNFKLFLYLKINFRKLSKLLIPKKLLLVLLGFISLLVVILRKLFTLAASRFLGRLVERIFLATNGYFEMSSVTETIGITINNEYDLYSYLLHPLYLIFGSRGYETTLGAFVNDGNLAGGATVGLFSVISTLSYSDYEAVILITVCFLLMFLGTRILLSSILKNITSYPILIVLYFSLITFPLALIDEYSYISFKIVLLIGSFSYAYFLSSFLPSKKY